MGFLNRLALRTIYGWKTRSLDDQKKLQLLRKWLESDDADRVQVAVHRLGELGGTDAANALEALLARTSWFWQRSLVFGVLLDARHSISLSSAVAALSGGRGYEWQLNVLEDHVSSMLALAYRENPDPVVAILRAPHLRTRRAAAKALEMMGWRPASTEDQAYYWVARHKAKKAAALGPVARPALVNGLNGVDSASERKDILEYLSKLPLPDTEICLSERFYSLLSAGRWDDIRRLGTDCIPLLLEIAKDASQEISARAESVKLLGLWRHRDAVPLIAQLLNHESTALVQAAVHALIEMPQEDVVPCLAAFVRSMKSFEEAAEAGRFFQNAAAVIRRMDKSGQELLSRAIDREVFESIQFRLLIHLQEQSLSGQKKRGW